MKSSDSSVHPLIIFRVPGEERYPQSHQLVTGVPQVSVLGPFFSFTLHQWDTSYKHIFFSYHCYADDTQLISTNNSCTNLRLPSLSMDTRTSLQLKLAKTEFLVFPETPTLQHDFNIQLCSSSITASNHKEQVVFNEPKRAHITPHFISLHWQCLKLCITSTFCVYLPLYDELLVLFPQL